MASAGRVCSLVSPDTDAVSGQPEFKFTPVAIKPWQYQSEALLLSPTVIDTKKLDYWVRQKVDGGYLYRVASNDTPKELENKLKPYCHSDSATVASSDSPAFKTRDFNARHLNFSSPGRGQYRFALIHGQQLRGCYLVAPSLQDQDFDWVQSLLDEPVDDNVERSILTGVASGKLAQGKTICACKQVGKTTLCNAIREENLTTVEQLGECTGAGTGCGTCVPELEQILSEELQQAGDDPKISPAANSEADSYKQAAGDGLIVRVGH